MNLQNTGKSLYNIPTGTKGFIKHNIQEDAFESNIVLWVLDQRFYKWIPYIWEKPAQDENQYYHPPDLLTFHGGSIKDLKNKWGKFSNIIKPLYFNA